jgi:hypothetical protein
MCANLAVSRRRASSCSLWSQIFPAVSLLLNAGSVATLHVGQNGLRRRRRDALLASQEGPEYEGAAPARLNNEHWIAATVTQDGK